MAIFEMAMTFTGIVRTEALERRRTRNYSEGPERVGRELKSYN